MTATSNRRKFLTALGGTTGLMGLSGCLSGGLPWSDGPFDRTLYVGAYHWGFVLFDEAGGEQDRVVLDRGASVRLVAFNTGAEQALESLPTSVRTALPVHDELEERNEDRIPPPSGGDLHERLEQANDRYPDHSVALMSSGGNHMGMSGGGMMMNSLALPGEAKRPTTATVTASQRGDYTLSCLTNCGYGHVYMDLDDALVVR